MFWSCSVCAILYLSSWVYGTPVPGFLPTILNTSLVGDLPATPNATSIQTWDSALLIGKNNASMGIDPQASWVDDEPISEQIPSEKRAIRGHGVLAVEIEGPSVVGSGTDHYQIEWHNLGTVKLMVNQNGTTANITWLDMYRDNCDNASIPYNYGRQLNNTAYLDSLDVATESNVNIMIGESFTYFKNLQCTAAQDPAGGGYSLARKDELRKLLQVPDNYWTIVFAGLATQMGISYGLYNLGHPDQSHFQNALPGINAAITGLGAAIIGWIAARPKVKATDKQVIAGTVATLRKSSNYMQRFWDVLRAASVAATEVSSASSSSQEGEQALGGGMFFGPSDGSSSSSDGGIISSLAKPIGGGVFVDPEAGGGGRKRSLDERQGSSVCLTVADIQDAVASIGLVGYPEIGMMPFSQMQTAIAGASDDVCF
ncbi:MAG: hypothetical protein M1828_000115 [Chrysothrix sp. TS-e1954]|nr:MAG: hypothetical protein M1828_000115 [Chrysothrix sp. TS-e1954]